jgi:hypothetical protein
MKTADLIDPMSEADKLRMLYRCLSKAYQREKDGLTAAREDAALMIDALINARILLSEGRSDEAAAMIDAYFCGIPGGAPELSMVPESVWQEARQQFLGPATEAAPD